MQQWMCAAIVGVVRLVKLRSIVSTCVTVFNDTVVKPVAGVGTAGFSFAPDRGELKVTMSALRQRGVSEQQIAARMSTRTEILVELNCIAGSPVGSIGVELKLEDVSLQEGNPSGQIKILPNEN